MKLQHLRHFVALADADSLSAAARQLGVSQPLLSRSIRGLEQELGVGLVELRGRRLVITARGVRVADAARDALVAVDRVHEAAGSAAAATVTVAATPSNQMLLSMLVPELMKALPDIRLRISTARSPADMVRMVSEELADVGFGDLPERPRGVQVAQRIAVEIVLASGTAATATGEVTDGSRYWATSRARSAT